MLAAALPKMCPLFVRLQGWTMQRMMPLAFSPTARSRLCLKQLGTPGPASPASGLVSAFHAPAKPPRSRLTSQQRQSDWRSDLPASRRPARCRFPLVSLPGWSSRLMQAMLPPSWCGGGWYSAGRCLKAAPRVPSCGSPVRRRDVGMEVDLPPSFDIHQKLRPGSFPRLHSASQQRADRESLPHGEGEQFNLLGVQIT